MSLPRRHLTDLSRLSRRKEREAQGRFLVEGVRSVEAAVLAGAPLDMLLVTHEMASDERVAPLLDRSRAAGGTVHLVSASESARISTVKTDQGVTAVARRVTTPDVEALRECTSVIVLDGVQDPGNVGTILRAAAWFGVEGALTDTDTADMEHPKVVRATMGGLWDLTARVRTPDLPDALETLRGWGTHLAGADLDGTLARDWAPPDPAALVMGSEAHGLSPEVARLLEARVSIRGRPASRGGVESLNVSVAAGILLHWWRG